MKRLQMMVLVMSMLIAANVHALDVLDYLTDKEGRYTGPTLEENIAKMDTDNNGFADVSEVRAFLVLKHGEDYQKAILDRWEVAATGLSCGTSFAKELTD